MANIPMLIEHMSSRPIAPIFARLNENEKNDENALKFMSVVDYAMSNKGIYDRINSTNFPKLLHELLGFKSYKSFRYFEYTSNKHFDGKYLQCQSAPCQFIGPYMLTLTHMATNHNAHHGSKMCLYCKNAELRTHVTNNSLQQCYEDYLRREQISDIMTESNGVNEVISDFYAVLKDCSKKLDVYTQRHLYSFIGKICNQTELLVGNYGGDIAPEITVGATRAHFDRAPKPIEIEKLKKVFEEDMRHYYGGNVSRFCVSGGDPKLDNEDSLEYFAQDEQQPGTSNSEPSQLRIEQVISMHDRSEAGSRAHTSMSMESNIDPFIQFLSTRYDNLGSKTKKDKAQLALLETIQKIDDAV